MNRIIEKVYNRLLLVLPDELYLRVKFRQMMGKKLDLKNPQTFSEKLQWLKLYNRRPEYTTMVDKYAVKDYVAKIIGEEYIIPTLGVWDRPEDIDWDSLPNQFVLKCTHDSGGLVICRDKSKLDKEAAIIKLRKTLKQNYFRKWREWPYKNVPRRIIAEEYIEPAPDLKDLRDYKFFCFDGEVKFFKIDFDRQTNHRANYFNKEGDLLQFGEASFPPDAEKKLETPSNLQEMIAIAEKLAKGNPFARIDLYDIKGRNYFGEITLYPASGLGRYTPENYDEILGQLLILPGESLGGANVCIKPPNNEIEITKPDLADYKFFCFGGEPKYCQVISGRNTTMSCDFFDKDWKHQLFHEPKMYPFSDHQIEKPSKYEEMWRLAQKLSQDKPFSRIDFYEICGKVYFGEITFFPTTGMGGFDPEEYDQKFGDMIKLPYEN